ncbi:hypothetical protein T484DRAFT_1819543, partial [Baffinella frigidus]
GQQPHWQQKPGDFGMQDLTGMANLNLGAQGHQAPSPQQQQQRRAAPPFGTHPQAGGGLSMEEAMQQQARSMQGPGFSFQEQAMQQQARSMQGSGFSFQEQALEMEMRHRGARPAGGNIPPAPLQTSDQMLLNMGHHLSSGLEDGGGGGPGGHMDNLPLPVETALRVVDDVPQHLPFGSPAHSHSGSLQGIRGSPGGIGTPGASPGVGSPGTGLFL